MRGDADADILELRSILGDELLGKLVGPPLVSLGLIQALPAAPASRIKVIERIVWFLRGSYDDEGIRRWFRRSRQQLGGKSPAEHLGDDWLADSFVALQVLTLAEKLR